MNYLSYIDHTTHQLNRQLQFLVSGETKVHEKMINEVINSLHNEKVLIVDSTKGDTNIVSLLRKKEYQIIDGVSGMGVYNPFMLSSVYDMSKMRILLNTLEMSEKEIQKQISYLAFIRHLRCLEKRNDELTLSILAAEYGSYELVAKKLNNLFFARKISNEQFHFLLDKYSEISASAADLEKTFPLLKPYVADDNKRQMLKESGKCAIILQTGKLGQDHTLRQMILQFMQFGMEETNNISTVIYLDNGCGNREDLYLLATELQSKTTLHVFSKDIFTTPDSVRTEIMNRADLKIYGRHNMKSASELERELGDVEIRKITYTEAYDRRWRNNTSLDILFKRNKTESYQTLAPQKQPLYRKEFLSSMMPNQIILDALGHKVFTTL